MNVIGIAGWKNSGKTTLVERLTAEMTRRGLTVSTVKHAHHCFDVDQPGRDSFRHRAAGAREVLVSSRRRWALMHENDGCEADLTALLARLDPADLVIVEGYKDDALLKIETRRRSAGGAALAPHDSRVIGVASDTPEAGRSPPEFDLEDAAAIADFILRHFSICDSRPALRTIGAAPQAISAMPPGVDWMPVDEALAKLKAQMSVSAGDEEAPISDCDGRLLAEDLTVRRSSPPTANSAVDGYGFRFEDGDRAECRLRLLPGRAAAGEPYAGSVPSGYAVCILTGAALPDGVDTVSLHEMTCRDAGEIRFRRPRRRGVNTRAAGEDLRQGEKLFSAGRRIKSGDIASLAAAGLTTVRVRRRLRVAVMSTGNEIVPGTGSGADLSIIDANRPMLMSVVSKWGYSPFDQGVVRDDQDALRHALSLAAESVDAVLISGGASSGDEDHVSRLLATEGELLAWRIAVKPGRPLVLARWNSVPVFALPGNPVAAFVCTLVFARPALNLLAGGEWIEPAGFGVAADFEKIKRAGRREYIRARLDAEGAAQAFRSEGSGLTTGLAWSDGLVELDDGARDIRKGSIVRYIPYSGYGL